MCSSRDVSPRCITERPLRARAAGIWEWSSDKLSLHLDVKHYFASRSEELPNDGRPLRRTIKAFVNEIKRPSRRASHDQSGRLRKDWEAYRTGRVQLDTGHAGEGL